MGSEMDPAFERLLRYHQLPTEFFVQQHILSRELALLTDAEWLAGEMKRQSNSKSDAKLAALVRDLGTFQALWEAGVSFPHKAADTVCETWSTLDSLQESAWEAVEVVLAKIGASATLVKLVAKIHGGSTRKTRPMSTFDHECEEKCPKSESPKKSLSSLIVDRDLLPTSDPSNHTLCLLDALRHRMSFPRLTVTKSSSSSSISHSQDNTNVGDDSDGEFEMKESPNCAVSLLSTLLKLLDEHDIPAQRELTHLLLARRMAVPLVTPLLLSHDHTAACRTEQLRLASVEGLQGAAVDLAMDRALPRVLVCSTLGKKASQTHTIVKNVFGVTSLQCEDRAAGVVFEEQFVVEVGLGFLRTDGDATQGTKTQCCIVLHAMVSSTGPDSVLTGPIEKLLPLVDMTLIEAAKDEHDELAQVYEKANHRILLYCEGKPGQRKHHGDALSLRCQLDQLKTKIPAFIPASFFSSDASKRVSLREATRLIPHWQTQRPTSDVFVKLSNRLNTIAIDPPHLRNQVYRIQITFGEAVKLRQKLTEAKIQRNESEVPQLEIQIEAKNKERDEYMKRAAEDPLLLLFMDILRVSSTEDRVLLLMDLEQKLYEANKKVKQVLFRDKQQLSATDQLALQAQLSTQSVLFEHLWRELSQRYVTSPTSFGFLAEAAAQHLLDGFAVELMDGQSDVVNQPWIMAVIRALDQKLPPSSSSPDGRNRFCVHSTCGIQSSGKSTMLNITYGTRLRTSVGQCTLGVNMMLVRAENRAGYDYVLVLDTEGVRSPEHKGKGEYIIRDNKMVALATLPAHKTSVMFAGEDDSMICDILPLVMLAVRTSPLSEIVDNGFGTQMFFMYRGIDLNNKSKLIGIMSKLKTELDRVQSMVVTGEELQNDDPLPEGSIKALDIRMQPNEPDNSDVRALGINKVSSIPPDDQLVTSYGADLMKLREYMHQRVASKERFLAPTAEQLLNQLKLVLSCLANSTWLLSFSNIRERFAYANLMAKMEAYKQKFSLACAEAFASIKKDLVNAELKDQLSLQEFGSTCVQKFQGLIAEAEQQTTQQVRELFRSDQESYEKWKDASLEDWNVFVKLQRLRFAQEVRLFVNSKTFPSMVENQLELMREAIHNNKHARFDDLWKSGQNALDSPPSLVSQLPDKIFSALVDLRQLATTDHEAYQNEFQAKWKFDMGANRLMVIDQVTQSQSTFDQTRKELQSIVSSANPQRALVDTLFSTLANACSLEELARSGYQEHVVFGIKQELQPLFEALPDKVRTIVYLTVFHFLLQIMIGSQRHYESAHYPAAMLARHKGEIHKFCEYMRRGVGVSEEFKRLLKCWVSDNIYQCALDHMTEELLPALATHPVTKLMSGSMCLSTLGADLLRLSDAKAEDKLFDFLKNPDHHVDGILKLAALRVLGSRASGMVSDIKKNLVQSIRNAAEKATARPVNTSKEIYDVKAAVDEHMKSGSQVFMRTFADLSLKQLPVHMLGELGRLEVPKSEFEGIAKDLSQFINALPTDHFPSQAQLSSKLVDLLYTRKVKDFHFLCAAPCPRCAAPCMEKKGHSDSDHRAVHQPRGLAGVVWNEDNLLVADSCTHSRDKGHGIEIKERLVSYRDFSQHYRGWSLDLPTCLSTSDDCKRIQSLREYLFAHHQDYIARKHPKAKLNLSIRFMKESEIEAMRAAHTPHIQQLQQLSLEDSGNIRPKGRPFASYRSARNNPADPCRQQ